MGRYSQRISVGDPGLLHLISTLKKGAIVASIGEVRREVGRLFEIICNALGACLSVTKGRFSPFPEIYVHDEEQRMALVGTNGNVARALGTLWYLFCKSRRLVIQTLNPRIWVYTQQPGPSAEISLHQLCEAILEGLNLQGASLQIEFEDTPDVDVHIEATGALAEYSLPVAAIGQILAAYGRMIGKRIHFKAHGFANERPPEGSVERSSAWTRQLEG